eukprot:700749-Rhodomonas_salina.1
MASLSKRGLDNGMLQDDQIQDRQNFVKECVKDSIADGDKALVPSLAECTPERLYDAQHIVMCRFHSAKGGWMKEAHTEVHGVSCVRACVRACVLWTCACSSVCVFAGVCALCADIRGYEQVFCSPVEDGTVLAYLGRQYKDLVLWPKTKTFTRSETKW